MNDYPKLVIFSNQAIPRIKSTYKGATVDTYNLKNFSFDKDDFVISLLSVSQYFEELQLKKATVISGITEEQLTFFNLSNTSYPTLKIASDDDYIVLPALDDALLCLQNRNDAINQLEESTSIIFSIFKYLETLHLNKMTKQNDALVDKAWSASADIHYTLEGFFFGWFEVSIP